MNFVALINLLKKRPEDRIVTFVYDEPGPMPPVVLPEDEDEEKDTEPPKEQ